MPPTRSKLLRTALLTLALAAGCSNATGPLDPACTITSTLYVPGKGFGDIATVSACYAICPTGAEAAAKANHQTFIRGNAACV